MKGWLVEQSISESTLHYVHGLRASVRRILIPHNGKMLSITPYGEQIFVFPMEMPDKQTGSEEFKYRLLREIEVPQPLVQLALDFFEAQEKLNKRIEEFQNL